MIRVLQVVTKMDRGGMETMLMNYYREIDRNKVQFDFLTHRDYDGDYGEEIKKLGGRIYHMPYLNPFSFTYRNALDVFFREHKEYKVVHVHQDYLEALILKILKKNGVPVRIAHSHNTSLDKNIKYPIKMFYRQFIPKYATDLMACGQAAGEWMFRGSPFKILNNAIDAHKYIYNEEARDNIRREFGIDTDELVVGHVGRFFPQKNHEFLIDIFAELVKKRNAKLILVGDGYLRQNIEKKVADMGLKDAVVFTGLRSDVYDILSAMDVFVIPSLYEGLSLVTVESQASGLPTLISNTISEECKITDLIHTEKLTASAEAWAEDILKLPTERVNTYDLIAKAGYDVKCNAINLEKYYIRKYESASK